MSFSTISNIFINNISFIISSIKSTNNITNNMSVNTYFKSSFIIPNYICSKSYSKFTTNSMCKFTSFSNKTSNNKSLFINRRLAKRRNKMTNLYTLDYDSIIYYILLRSSSIPPRVRVRVRARYAVYTLHFE